MIQVITTKQALIQSVEQGYEFLLAVSNDTLAIIDKNQELVQWICRGNDNDGVIVRADDENSFLDAIIVIKKMIQRGMKPRTFLES